MPERLDKLQNAAKALQAMVARFKVELTGQKDRLAQLETSLQSLTSRLSEAGEDLTDAELEELSRWLRNLQDELQEIQIERRSVYLTLMAHAALLAVLFIGGTPVHLLLLNSITSTANATTIDILGFQVTGQAGQLVVMSILAGVWGMAGGSISAITALSSRYARGTLIGRYMPAHWTKPIRGAFVGAVIFMLVQAGLISPFKEPGSSATPGAQQSGHQTLPVDLPVTFAIFAVSAVAGFQERGFLQKLDDLVKALLGVRTEDKQAQAEQKQGAGTDTG